MSQIAAGPKEPITLGLIAKEPRGLAPGGHLGRPRGPITAAVSPKRCAAWLRVAILAGWLHEKADAGI